MNKKGVIKLMVITGILCLPLFPFLLYAYNQWARKPDESSEKKLMKMSGIVLWFLFIELCIISFVLYQYGRLFIHVMGTFY